MPIATVYSNEDYETTESFDDVTFDFSVCLHVFCHKH